VTHQPVTLEMKTISYFLAGVSIGIIVFQSAFVAPIVFKQLKDGASGPFLRALFPRFFAALAVLGIGLAIDAWLSTFMIGWVAGLAAFAAGAMAFLIIPATNKARDQGHAGKFKRLHTVSVLLMLIIAGANLVVVFN